MHLSQWACSSACPGHSAGGMTIRTGGVNRLSRIKSHPAGSLSSSQACGPPWWVISLACNVQWCMAFPESVATLPPFGTMEGQKWFDQISSQWESQKKRFALIYFGKIQFLPPCIWNLPFMSYSLWYSMFHCTLKAVILTFFHILRYNHPSLTP